MNSLTLTVALEQVRFFAYHGFYPEEQLTGNEFLLDIRTESEMFGSGGDELANTVNYERLLAIARTEMEKPRKLLETVAYDILQGIRQEFISVKYISVAIRKMNLPVKAELRNSLVQVEFRR